MPKSVKDAGQLTTLSQKKAIYKGKNMGFLDTTDGSISQSRTYDRGRLNPAYGVRRRGKNYGWVKNGQQTYALTTAPLAQ